MRHLGRSFFNRYAPTVARELVGCRLVRKIGGRTLSGIIVEVEAYRGGRDPASHAYRGRTLRNEVMFGPPGHAYVYFTMGMHHCLNITAEASGTPAAVLLRAVEPLDEVEMMKRNRGVAEILGVASGPGNLTKAFAIDLNLNGEDMVTSDRLYVERGVRMKVGISSRVGVSLGTTSRWRFYAKGNPYVSKGKPSSPRTHN